MLTSQGDTQKAEKLLLVTQQGSGYFKHDMDMFMYFM